VCWLKSWVEANLVGLLAIVRPLLRILLDVDVLLVSILDNT
jgi:hypothetical protein